MSTGTKAPSKVIAYLRVSTQEQSNGLDVQRAEIERWAAARGLAVSEGDWFTDVISGTTSIDKRPKLLKALATLKRGDVLVVQKRDRIARDAFVAIMVDRTVKSAKATLACAQGGDGDDPSAVLMRHMHDGFSAFEVAMIKARTKAALAVKKARGECVGTVPYGFRREGAVLVEDAAEQVVLECVRGFAAAGLSQRAIVAELEAAAHVARSGKAFQKTQVQRMLAGAA
jgi:DNA invertase Pin-like site-specific DNA recombinase